MTTTAEYRERFSPRDAAPGPSPFLRGTVEMCRTQIAADPLRAFGHRARLANIVSNTRLPEASHQFARAILAELAEEGSSHVLH